MPLRLVAAALAAALLAVDAAAPPLVALGLDSESAASASVLALGAFPSLPGLAPLTGAAASVAPPPLAPCLFARAATLGALALPAFDGTSLSFVALSSESAPQPPVELRPPFIFATLSALPGDSSGLLYGVGMPPPGAPFLSIASVDASSGAVVASPLLVDNVQECASSFESASGLLAITYMGPLQLAVIEGVPVAPGANASAAFAVALLPACGVPVALAACADCGPMGGLGVLFLADADAEGAIALGSLQLLDAASGNTSVAAPLPAEGGNGGLVGFRNAGQGALVWDAATRRAFALAQATNASGALVDVLVVFDVAARPPAATAIMLDPAGGPLAPLGLWGLMAL